MINEGAISRECGRALTIPEDYDQKTVLKEQNSERRHGIEGLLNRVTAYVRLISSGGFQPPSNFAPESRATPTSGRGLPVGNLRRRSKQCGELQFSFEIYFSQDEFHFVPDDVNHVIAIAKLIRDLSGKGTKIYICSIFD